MLKKFLGEVLVIIAGKQAEELSNLLNDKKYINEFSIAKKMDLTINQTRNLLYKISDFGLVSFIRKKDKKKGWYTYFWKIETLKCLEFLKNILLKKIGQFTHQIKSRETKRFYICERCNIEFNEENALLHNFTCNECGDIFVTKDNTKLLRELNKRLDKLKRELELVNEEIDIENKKIEKRKLKELKKQEKIKAEKKVKKKAKKTSKKKLVKKKAKKVTKKIPKKKISKKKIPKKKVKKKKKVTKKKTMKKSSKNKIKSKRTKKK